MEDIRKQILDEIKEHFSMELLGEIEELMIKEKYRQAYAKMYELKKSKQWSPTDKFLQLLEKFWWIYAN